MWPGTRNGCGRICPSPSAQEPRLGREGVAQRGHGETLGELMMEGPEEIVMGRGRDRRVLLL